MKNLSAYRWLPRPLTTRLVPALAGLALLATAAPALAQTPTFAPVVPYSTGANSVPESIAVADVNGDGKPDALLANADSNTLGVLLNTTVFAAPTLTSLSPTSGPVGTRVTLTGTSLSGATGVRFNGTAAATFSVSNATTATATVPAGATTGPVTITNGGGTSNGQNFIVVTTTGTAPAVAATQVALYPNPVRGSFAVQLPYVGSATPVQAQLVNALGQVVWQLQAIGGSLAVPTAGLAAGVYMLRLQAGAAAWAKRVVVE